MADRSDIISAMIYPSHWSPGFAGIDYPDLKPYELVDFYMGVEEEKLQEINSNCKSRPWLQAFTDYSLAEGTYQEYGRRQIKEQIKALKEHGVNEYLLWNISGDYPL